MFLAQLSRASFKGTTIWSITVVLPCAAKIHLKKRLRDTELVRVAASVSSAAHAREWEWQSDVRNTGGSSPGRARALQRVRAVGHWSRRGRGSHLQSAGHEAGGDARFCGRARGA